MKLHPYQWLRVYAGTTTVAQSIENVLGYVQKTDYAGLVVWCAADEMQEPLRWNGARLIFSTQADAESAVRVHALRMRV